MYKCYQINPPNQLIQNIRHLILNEYSSIKNEKKELGIAYIDPFLPLPVMWGIPNIEKNLCTTVNVAIFVEVNIHAFRL